jgi:hypothetical protein
VQAGYIPNNGTTSHHSLWQCIIAARCPIGSDIAFLKLFDGLDDRATHPVLLFVCPCLNHSQCRHGCSEVELLQCVPVKFRCCYCTTCINQCLSYNTHIDTAHNSSANPQLAIDTPSFVLAPSSIISPYQQLTLASNHPTQYDSSHPLRNTIMRAYTIIRTCSSAITHRETRAIPHACLIL